MGLCTNLTGGQSARSKRIGSGNHCFGCQDLGIPLEVPSGSCNWLLSSSSGASFFASVIVKFQKERSDRMVAHAPNAMTTFKMGSAPNFLIFRLFKTAQVFADGIA